MFGIGHGTRGGCCGGTHEIRTIAKLKHPYIARLYDAGTLADGTPWFVMEYVEGLRLTEYCRNSRTIREQLMLFRSICEAVQYSHGQEIIHRDLKPSNILVEADGTPKLLDFGIAREIHRSDYGGEMTQRGPRFMSPYYAAPEWIRDNVVGFSTDVYSLGVILYERYSPAGCHFQKKRTLRTTLNTARCEWLQKNLRLPRSIAQIPAERTATKSKSGTNFRAKNGMTWMCCV